VKSWRRRAGGRPEAARRAGLEVVEKPLRRRVTPFGWLDRSYVAQECVICPLSREFELMRRVAFWLHESGLRHFLGAFGSIWNRIPPQNRVRKQLFLATPWTRLSSVSPGRWPFSALMTHVTSVQSWYPVRGRRAGVKMGRVARRRRRFLGP